MLVFEFASKLCRYGLKRVLPTLLYFGRLGYSKASVEGAFQLISGLFVQ